MHRTPLLTAVAPPVLALLVAAASGTVTTRAQQSMHMTTSKAMPDHAASMMTPARKIANAMTAAPPSISSKATILDWPPKEGAQPTVLRKGTNGWSCLPDMPDTMGNDPMCLDDAWMKWVEAYLSKTTPNVGHVGIGYMLAPGGGWGSNTDPYAMKETTDNQWGHHAPHLMIVVPDVPSLSGMSTDPANGGPYVMYAGTPYAHIMAPATLGGMAGTPQH